MIKNNLIDEIKAFWHKKPPNDCLLQKAIGLNPITAYINDEISKESAIELMQIQTRQYAKRQTTWFKGQSPTNTWINPTFEQISILIKNNGF
jgi:tRNA dimethylallyltransferase